MAPELSGKVAIVTGSTGGIGAATAIALARLGAKVVVSGRREREGADVVNQITKAGGQAIFQRADITKEADIAGLVEKAVAHFGRIDIAVNNAGVEGAIGIPTHEQTAEFFHQIMNANALGVLLSMKHEVRAMLKSGGGAIVNTSSIAGLIGFGGASCYVASKHAVVGLTRTAALEYAKQNIRVNAVCPAAIDTPMLDRFEASLAKVAGIDEQAMSQQFAAMHPIGRTGKPEEIAEAICWLCSPRASFVTGQALAVDGGFTTQ